MKRRIQTINNKILVDGKETELINSEMLVETINGKIVLKEFIDGVLTTVSEGNVTPLEQLINRCVTFKKATNSGESADTITFTVANTDKTCLCTVSTTGEQDVVIKSYTPTSLAVSIPAGATIYIAFPEAVSSGSGTPSQETITKAQFLEKISFFM